LILRRASLDDMPALARLHRYTVTTSLPFVPQLHTPEEDAWWFAERLYAANQVLVADDLNGLPIGYMAFRPDFIEHLFVHPSHQGAGLGLMFLERAKEGAAELTLWTFQQNLRARRFYERHGFSTILETDGADNEEKLPDVLYRWRRADPTDGV
jgi:GNAT superfamily N-acetyltransferase